ncbi:MAG: hypothetical protein C4526_02720 [Nitrospiraceae bacterium]|nr:MAG: hypothetical protein C4526_02720 [Nitrospiraceae bacterium]
MRFAKRDFLSSVLDESPFFTELSIKEKNRLMEELIEGYPQLFQSFHSNYEVGYEAGWLPGQGPQ